MKDYSEFVGKFVKLLKEARDLSTPIDASIGRIKCSDKKKVLIFAPHPDDECISGALARRFQTEAGAKIINVAVTLGSDKSRRKARLSELKDAVVKSLDWGLRVCGENSGFDSINPKTRKSNPQYWNKCARLVADIIIEEKPVAIFAPHKRDWNKTHMGVALLIEDALKLVPREAFDGYFINTEFWGAMWKANLLSEVSTEVAASLVFGISRHTGEVARNDYHVRLPAYFADNVRRGGEIVGGMGKHAPNFAMGAVYNVKIRGNGNSWKNAWKDGVFLESGADALKAVFQKLA